MAVLVPDAESKTSPLASPVTFRRMRIPTSVSRNRLVTGDLRHSYQLQWELREGKGFVSERESDISQANRSYLVFTFVSNR